MSNFTTTNTAINEIVKAVDFEFTHDQAIKNATLGIQAILTDGEKDFIIGGKVKPYPSGGMNIIISPIYGHCANSGLDFVETLTSPQPISIEDSDPAYDRIDTVQVRGVYAPYDFQDRRFRDPVTSVETIENIPTKKRIILEVTVKKGAPGSVTAKTADAGFIKLAEIVVPAASVGISAENIKNITARSADAENGNWTMEKSRTFNPGYLADIIATLLTGHKEDGGHKDAVIKAANILFGNQANAVRGMVIPTGDSIKVLNEDFDALAGITQVLAAIAGALNLAYPYANNLFSRYLLLNATPVAASTENVDVAAGGETVIDGIACTVGQMVFLKDQTDPIENGLWEVQTGAWNRYAGFAAVNPNVFNGKFVLIKNGDVNNGKMFYLDGENNAIGTSPLNFRESRLSPSEIPGTVVYRDDEGKTEYDKKLNDLYFNINQEILSNADMVDGNGRDLMKVVLGHGFEEMTTPSLRREAIADTMDKLRTKHKPNRYRGLMLGDYLKGIDFTGTTAPTSAQAPNGGPQPWNDTYQNNKIIIAGFNTYKQAGDTENTEDHILFVFRDVLFQMRQRPTNDNTGGYAYNNVANEIRAYLEGLNGDGNGTLAIKLEECLNGGVVPPGGKYLYTIRKCHSTKGNYAWNNYTLWLPSEIEVHGFQTYGDELAQYNTNIPIPIYQKSMHLRCKKMNGVRKWYWEATPAASSSAYFCGVNYDGGANCSYASYADGGVSPAFCVR